MKRHGHQLWYVSTYMFGVEFLQRRTLSGIQAAFPIHPKKSNSVGMLGRDSLTQPPPCLVGSKNRGVSVGIWRESSSSSSFKSLAFCNMKIPRCEKKGCSEVGCTKDWEELERNNPDSSLIIVGFYFFENRLRRS